MKQLIIIITFTVALGFANAQERLFFDLPHESITTDIQGNVFLTYGFNLNMLSADGTKLLNYGEPTYGNIAHVDAGIASKILVFYRENGIITLLNNELAPLSNPLSLFDKSLMTISLAAMGNPNKIVLYDEANQNLLITDLSLNILSQTHIVFPGDFHPTDMQVVPEHRIALLDTLHGICLFDFFGTLEKEIPLSGIQAMQLQKNNLFYLKNSQLYQFTMPSEETPMLIRPLDVALPEISTFHIWQRNLYYIDNQNEVYKIRF